MLNELLSSVYWYQMIFQVCIYYQWKFAQLENTSDHQNLYDGQNNASLAIRAGLGEL